MPYIPRRAPGGLPDLSTLPKAPARTTAVKPAVPYHGSREDEQKKLPRKGTKLIDKLSMREWDVDPLKVYKTLFSKEVHVDEHSGLVSDRKPGSR